MFVPGGGGTASAFALVPAGSEASLLRAAAASSSLSFASTLAMRSAFIFFSALTSSKRTLTSFKDPFGLDLAGGVAGALLAETGPSPLKAFLSSSTAFWTSGNSSRFSMPPSISEHSLIRRPALSTCSEY